MTSKRVLFLTRAFYPNNSAGAHRNAKFAKYLPCYGWDPTVLCPDWTKENCSGYFDPRLDVPTGCRVMRVPFKSRKSNSARGLLDRWFRKFVPSIYPFELYQDMKKHIRAMGGEQRFDAVIASSPPMMTLNVARVVSQKWGLPWIADLRDLPDELDEGASLSTKVQIRHEIFLCQTAAAITTVSQPLADKLSRRHNVPVHVILNGFDADDFPAIGSSSDGFFTVVYAGLCYGERDPSPLFDALDLILRESNGALPRLRVRFYGDSPEHLRSYFQGRPCARLVEPMGRVPFRDVIRIEQQATILLLLTHQRSRGILTSKVFEYLGAGRPILVIPGGDDAVDKLIQDTRAGIMARNAGEICSLLRKWYREWEQTGSVAYSANPEAVAQFTRKRGTEQLASVLDKISGDLAV